MTEMCALQIHPNKSTRVLAVEIATIDFIRDAFSHLKVIAADKGGQALLDIVNVVQDASDLYTNDGVAFMTAAKTRQWDREKSVRALA